MNPFSLMGRVLSLSAHNTFQRLRIEALTLQATELARQCERIREEVDAAIRSESESMQETSEALAEVERWRTRALEAENGNEARASLGRQTFGVVPSAPPPAPLRVVESVLVPAGCWYIETSEEGEFLHVPVGEGERARDIVEGYPEGTRVHVAMGLHAGCHGVVHGIGPTRGMVNVELVPPATAFLSARLVRPIPVECLVRQGVREASK